MMPEDLRVRIAVPIDLKSIADKLDPDDTDMEALAQLRRELEAEGFAVENQPRGELQGPEPASKSMSDPDDEILAVVMVPGYSAEQAAAAQRAIDRWCELRQEASPERRAQLLGPNGEALPPAEA